MHPYTLAAAAILAALGASVWGFFRSTTLATTAGWGLAVVVLAVVAVGFGVWFVQLGQTARLPGIVLLASGGGILLAVVVMELFGFTMHG